MSLACAIETEDAVTLPARLFLPRDTAPRASVLIAPAWAVPQGYYARFAQWLSEQGLAVLTFDYRGIGEAKPLHMRGHPATLSDWGKRDVTAALDHLVQRFPKLPHFYIGHSFGAQALGLVEGGERIDGALLLATGFVTWEQWLTPRGLPTLAQVSLAMPLFVRLLGYLPAWSGIGEDVPAEVALEWRRWLLSPGYLLDHVPGAKARYANVGGPVRIVRFTDDRTIGEEAVTLMREGLFQAQVDVIAPEDWQLSDIGHLGYFRPRCQTAWPYVVDTLETWRRRRLVKAS